MICLYIDESESMTTQHRQSEPYFVASVVRPSNPDKLRVLYKRFVKSHLEELRAADDGRMFHKDGKFKELKGSMFTPALKKEFTSYFCRDNTFEIFYILIDNKAITGELFANTSRGFNYVLKLAFEFFLRHGYLPDDHYILQLDERNERTDSRHFLQDYLNTELRPINLLSSDIMVQYFDSSCNNLIQIADVLANLYYSELRTSAYSDEFQKMCDIGCLKYIFRFPPK